MLVGTPMSDRPFHGPKRTTTHLTRGFFFFAEVVRRLGREGML